MFTGWLFSFWRARCGYSKLGSNEMAIRLSIRPPRASLPLTHHLFLCLSHLLPLLIRHSRRPEFHHSFTPGSCFTNPPHRRERPSSSLRTDSTNYHPDRIFSAISTFVVSSLFFLQSRLRTNCSCLWWRRRFFSLNWYHILFISSLAHHYKKASIRWQDSARRQLQAGLRGDVVL